MVIIPVIDISQGQVVHARLGLRSNYRPVHSQLCEGSAPIDIVQAFMKLHDFGVIYIADLDAISGFGTNHGIISEISRQFPHLTLWLDNGSTSVNASLHGKSVVPVIGSETGIYARDLRSLYAQKPDYILSLDFTGDGFAGDNEWLHAVSDWPQDIIIMTLSRVGSNLGPDYSLIHDIQRLAGNRRFYCGGGVRYEADLLQLAKAGIHGALLATALHNRSIGKSIIERISGTR